MRRVGIWERNEGLKQALEEELVGRGMPRPVLLGAKHPAELTGEFLDLLVVSPRAAGWAGAAGLNCRLLLLPGSAGVLARGMQVEGAVSYGSGLKNTITVSSIEGDRVCIAVQRELVTVDGDVVERQELVLSHPEQEDTELLLARVGALLLLGGSI